MPQQDVERALFSEKLIALVALTAVAHGNSKSVHVSLFAWHIYGLWCNSALCQAFTCLGLSLSQAHHEF